MSDSAPTPTVHPNAGPGAGSDAATPFAALHGLPVLVLGLGTSGLAMARWCARHGARVQVWDSRAGTEALAPAQVEALSDTAPQATLRGGPLDPVELVAQVRLVLKSPGLAPEDERIAPLLAAARQAAIPVWGELDLFHRALGALAEAEGYRPNVLAITGTNGKTTTTALTRLLVERAGRRAVAAGNIGPAMLDALASALDAPADERPEVWVLELSSFQLYDSLGFEPDAAAVLNLTQDHLDWHGSMEAYAAAKAKVLGRGAVAVVNRDDPRVEAMVAADTTAPASPPRARPGARPVAPERRVLRFGLGPPARPGDFGLVEEAGMAWLVRALDDGEPPAGRRKRSGAEPSTEDEPLHLQRLMPADALRIRGRHNAANALAALALATSIGCPLAPMLHGLREYEGEPHRVSFVARLDDVEAFDDSKGTNVGATVAALDGLGAEKAPARLIVILGGDGKGQDFSPLVAPLQRHARAIATIGRDAPALEAALGASCRAAGLAWQHHDSLEAAVRWSFAQAHAGDAVLLSPACASLDMFRHYGHRAEVFREAVEALARDRGVVA
jgi:UDP-N-acetylmuramoylalanine--D-glutamate ligase